MNVSGGPYSRLSPALVAVAGSVGPATPGSPAGSRPKRRSSASRLTPTTRCSSAYKVIPDSEVGGYSGTQESCSPSCD